MNKIRRQNEGYKKAGESVWEGRYKPVALKPWPAHTDFSDEEVIVRNTD
jgi:hypothetical protein